MHQFHKFTPAWNSTCFGQLLCPSSGVYSLYTRHWCMSYRFEDSFRAGPGRSCSKAVFKPVWHTPVPSVQWINSWWWAEELPETRKVSCRSKFGKLVHLVGFITKKHIHVSVTSAFNWNDHQLPTPAAFVPTSYERSPDTHWTDGHASSNAFLDVTILGAGHRRKMRVLILTTMTLLRVEVTSS